MNRKLRAILLAAVVLFSFYVAPAASAARTENPRPAATGKTENPRRAETGKTEKPRPATTGKTEKPGKIEKPEKPRPTATAQAGRSRARGPALKKGDCIGVLAPASWESRSQWESAIQLLHERGYRVKLAPSCTASYGFYAGTDEMRAADVNRFFQDDEVKAILCLRGGYGSGRLLDQLDYAAIARHPKLFIGYSDITAMHIALGEKSGIATVHGPMLTSLADDNLPSYTSEGFFRGIATSKPLGELPVPAGAQMETVVPGTAEGIVVGGNLSVLLSLVGTPYELKGDGVLLFLEDIDLLSYQLDRALNQLCQTGFLDRVNGLLFGAFTGGDAALDYGDFTTAEVIGQYAQQLGKPAIMGVPAGHVRNNAFLPFGVHAVMKANEDGTASLVFDEPAALPSEQKK